MKRKITTIATIFISILTIHLTSCGENVDVKNPKIEIKKENIDLGDFKHATWKIDSVLENRIIIDRLVEDSVFQIFNFRKNGIFSSMEVTSKCTKDEVIGTWKVEKDSVFIFGKAGNIAMRYGYEMKGPVLTLNGNFQISSNIKKMPTFYLSKYIE